MKINKNVWGVLAFFPWMVIVSVVAIHMTQGLQPVVNLSLFGLIAYAFIALTLFAIWIIFTIHSWRNKRIEWVLIMLFLSPFVYPIYWWKYIRHPQLQLYESSTSLDKENIKPFLEKLNKAIDSGLDLDKTNELLSFTFNVDLDDQKQTEFFVTHKNQKVLVRYSVYAEDIDSFGIYIFTSKELSELIDSEMAALFEEFGN